MDERPNHTLTYVFFFLKNAHMHKAFVSTAITY